MENKKQKIGTLPFVNDKQFNKEQKPEQEPEIESSKKKLQECEKLRDEYLTGWQRSRADFLNHQKEEGERLEDIFNFAKGGWFLKLLTILDNLERAEKEIPNDLKNSQWLQGVFQIENQFRNFLKEERVEEIKIEGEKFDPNFHEAVEEVAQEGKETGLIIEFVQKGYLLNGRVLRPAKVRVAK